MDSTVTCDAPGGCQLAARQVILARSGENMVGNGMAVWTAYWRCGLAHRADEDARRIRQADPEAVVVVFMGTEPLEPGAFTYARL